MQKIIAKLYGRYNVGLSVYTDSAGFFNVTSYFYSIATVDSCGIESTRSSSHRTIHLTVSPGQGNDNEQSTRFRGK